MLRTKVQCKKLVVITRKSFPSEEIAHLSISSSITYVNAILRTRVLTILARSEITCPEKKTTNPSSPTPHRDESFFTISVNKDFFFFFYCSASWLRTHLKKYGFLKKGQVKWSLSGMPSIKLQQHKLFGLASPSTLQISCRGAILVKQKMCLNVLKTGPFFQNSGPRWN